MLHRHASPAVAASYSLGAVAGALVSAGVLLVVGGLLSPIPIEARATIAIGLLTLLGLHAVGVLCLELPERTHQIARETFNAAPAGAAFRFAAELGTGVRTYITTPAPYALAIVIALCPPASLSAAVASTTLAAVGFGLGRARIVASQAWRRTVAIEHPRSWLRVSNHVSLLTALTIAIAALAGS